MSNVIQPLLRPILQPLLRSPLEAGVGWSPRALFAAGEQGAWYDPSDLSTLYQDAAGTTPVTAVEQPVGLMLDKSGRGNHASQSTAAARPALSARKNLLVNTASGLSSGSTSWTGTNQSGTLQADGSSLIYRTSTTANSHSLHPVTLPIGTTATLRVKVKKATVGDKYAIRMIGTYPDRADAVIDLDTGAIVYSGGVNYTVVNAEASGPDVDGFYLLSLTAMIANTGMLKVEHGPAVTASGTWEGMSAELLNAYVKEPQLELGPATTRYQRVTTATDYDSAGFPRLVNFDTVDDALGTTFPTSLGTACTVARSIPGTGAQILTAQTVGTTFTDTTDSHALVIVDRALTASETTLLTGWLNGRAGL